MTLWRSGRRGTYIDGTAGGGGHSEAILQRLTTGRLLSIDQDPDAIAACTERLSRYPGSVIRRGNFSQMGEIAAGCGIREVDGVLLDIGVSSYQLDTPERGFSYHADAPLDMRMSQEGPTAADLVNTLSWQKLAETISRYGEDKNAVRIAKAIAAARKKGAYPHNPSAGGYCPAGSAGGSPAGAGASGPQDLPGPADCHQRGAGQAFGGAGRGVFPAAARRKAGGHYLPFPGRPHGKKYG